MTEVKCPYHSEYLCESEEQRLKCPEGCKLPKCCDTCGIRTCVLTESGDTEDCCDVWMSPYYFDNLDDSDEGSQ